jgi:hypothetical protein
MKSRQDGMLEISIQYTAAVALRQTQGYGVPRETVDRMEPGRMEGWKNERSEFRRQNENKIGARQRRVNLRASEVRDNDGRQRSEPQSYGASEGRRQRTA